MDNKTRMILLGQYKVREKIAELTKDKDEKEYCEFAQEILQRGYSDNYHELDCTVEEELSEEDSNLVWDILAMYRAITDKYESSEELQNEFSLSQVRFRGFDLNDETELYCYYRFLVEEDERYEEFLGEDGHAINSHFPHLSQYKHMLELWERMGKPTNLSDEQFKELVR